MGLARAQTLQKKGLMNWMTGIKNYPRCSTKKKKIKKKKTLVTWDNFKGSDICVTEVPKEEKRKWEDCENI